VGSTEGRKEKKMKGAMKGVERKGKKDGS